MPTAFVLMPFDGRFDAVYSGFICPALEESGFDVTRADDIESGGNILQYIIDQIATSDLVIAELTGNNPNVLYELGIAHALGKPVIHLTQTVEEVPFDLSSYRMLAYDRDFSRIEAAKERLSNHARAVSEGHLQFGNPVTDFYRRSVVPYEAQEDSGNEPDSIEQQRTVGIEGGSRARTGGAVDQDERGFLDHLVDVNEGYTVAGQVAARVAHSLQSLTYNIEEASNDISRISSNPNATAPAAAVAVCRRLAGRFASFNQDVNQANIAFAEVLANTEDSLELLFAAQAAQPEGLTTETLERIDELRALGATISEARGAVLSFADVMDGLPRIERRLNGELITTSAEIRVMAGHLGRIHASITRAIAASGTSE